MSTIRSVLLHLDATPSSATWLEFACRLALRHEAALSAMFVAPPLPGPTKLASCKGPAALPLPQPIDRAPMDRAKSLFDNACAGGRPQMRWLESTGADTVEAFCRQALYADLLVLGQHDPAAALPGFLESVLISTDKPALILPFAGRLETTCRDVLIGWNATPQAARAVTAALPWLRRARRVHVLEAEREPAQHQTGELDIAQYLQLHGIVPALHRHRTSPTDAGEFLLSFASEVGADLLVMGCYAHSRARELMLGGASRSVLQTMTMTMPVLMAH